MVQQRDDNDDDWYEALVIDNSILGKAFSVGEICFFRRRQDETAKKLFEVFNLRDMYKTLSGEEAKTQLRAARDSHKNVLRARDQGYINWRYGLLKNMD